MLARSVGEPGWCLHAKPHYTLESPGHGHTTRVIYTTTHVHFTRIVDGGRHEKRVGAKVFQSSHKTVGLSKGFAYNHLYQFTILIYEILTIPY